MCKMCFRRFQLLLLQFPGISFWQKEGPGEGEGGKGIQVLNIKYDHLMLSNTYPGKVSQRLFIIHKQLTYLQGAIGYAIHNCYTVVAYSRGVSHSSWSVFRFICNLYF